MHGYAIAAAIRRSTEDALLVEEGVLYPALYRMEAKAWVEAEWGLSENKRRAKYYRLTPEGRRHFRNEEKSWNAYSTAVAKLLGQPRRQVRNRPADLTRQLARIHLGMVGGEQTFYRVVVCAETGQTGIAEIAPSWSPTV